MEPLELALEALMASESSSPGDAFFPLAGLDFGAAVVRPALRRDLAEREPPVLVAALLQGRSGAERGEAGVLRAKLASSELATGGVAARTTTWTPS